MRVSSEPQSEYNHNSDFLIQNRGSPLNYLLVTTQSSLKFSIFKGKGQVNKKNEKKANLWCDCGNRKGGKRDMSEAP